MRRYSILTAIICFTLLSSIAFANPQKMWINGRLKDSNGDLVSNGQYNFTFRIYSAVTGGAALWSEEQNRTQVTGGLYSILLGNNTAITLPFDRNYWLETVVNSDTLSPRTQISSSGYSFRSNITDNIGANANLTGTVRGNSNSIINLNNVNASVVNASSSIWGEIIYEAGTALSSLYCLLTGCTMSGDIAMGNNDITGAGWVNATNVNASNSLYSNTIYEGGSLLSSLYCLLTGCTMSGDIAMGNNDITGTGDVNASVLNASNSIWGETIYETGTSLSSKYLGIAATAANSQLLDSLDSTFFPPLNTTLAGMTQVNTTTLGVTGNAEIAALLMSGNLNMGDNAITNINWAGSDDGAGSELDADKLDGYTSADFAPVNTTLIGMSQVNSTIFNGTYYGDGSQLSGIPTNPMTADFDMGDNAITNINWASSDDGAGSSLDADLLDTYNSAYFTPVNSTFGTITVDKTNSRVGIGTASPQSLLNVHDGDVNFSSDTAGSMFYFKKNVGLGISLSPGLNSPASLLHTYGGDVNFSSDTASNPGFFYSNQLNRVGIGTESPLTTLDVVGALNVTVTAGGAATIGTANIATGNQAIATGASTIANGTHATAMGLSSVASGSNSFAAGSSAVANGQVAVALGQSTTASGDQSTAMGQSTTASGQSAVAIGEEVISSGVISTALGWGTIANNSASFAVGHDTIASGSVSTAMGEGTVASGQSAVAMGESTVASGDWSTAMGRSTRAEGTYSTAMGYLTNASGRSSFSAGESTNASGLTSVAMGMGTTASGAYSTAMGQDTTANGTFAATAMGEGTVASGDYSTAMGSWTVASSQFSTAMGSQTTANGTAATAMGISTIASGAYSLAVGNSVVASGSDSTAMGTSTVASGASSTAMGSGTIANGSMSTAMGESTIASGTTSFAIGDSTVASGADAIAMGDSITVSGQNSVGIGLSTTAQTMAQDNSMGIMGGKVGIGTGAPEQLLHIYTASGNTYGLIESTTSGSESALLIKSSQQWGLSVYNNDSMFRIVDSSNIKYPFKIEANTPTNTLYLDSGGYVGIGTSSPVKTLDVVGDINATGSIFENGLQLGSRYLGIASIAADSQLLDSLDSTFFPPLNTSLFGMSWINSTFFNGTYYGDGSQLTGISAGSNNWNGTADANLDMNLYNISEATNISLADDGYLYLSSAATSYIQLDTTTTPTVLTIVSSGNTLMQSSKNHVVTATLGNISLNAPSGLTKIGQLPFDSVMGLDSTDLEVSDTANDAYIKVSANVIAGAQKAGYKYSDIESSLGADVFTDYVDNSQNIIRQNYTSNKLPVVAGSTIMTQTQLGLLAIGTSIIPTNNFEVWDGLNQLLVVGSTVTDVLTDFGAGGGALYVNETSGYIGIGGILDPVTHLDVLGNITVNSTTGQGGITMYDEAHAARCMLCWSDGICNSTAGAC
ncbi:MAG: hypothetical protein ISS95_00395 [Candidatus Aenigmarchaeota archaeon]|nr:hypothetical protein [Candidatus Aenigmarchaeota archaeon]